MTKHIGIIGVSSEGAALCYTAICEESWKIFGKFVQPEITLHNHSLKSYIKFIEADNWDGVAELMISSIKKLKIAGADFAICPDNTVHIPFEKVKNESPIPLIGISEAVADECKRLEYKKVAILGTKYTMQSQIYSTSLKKLGIELVTPNIDDQEIINKIIFDKLGPGQITNTSSDQLLKFIYKFKNNNCNAVILGCTELPLIFTKEDSPITLLDSTRLLAKRATQYAFGK